MRLLGPPVTEVECAAFLLRSTEKKIGEVEARLRRRPSPAYRDADRRRDVALLVRCREVVDDCRRFLAAVEAAARRRAA